MKRKLMSLLLVGAMTTAMFAGCGSSSDDAASTDNTATTNDAADASTESGSSAEGGKLTVWCWDPAFNIFSMEEATKVYQKDHPDVDVEIVETPWDDVQTKLTTAATSGDLSTLPDILLMQDNAFQKNVISYPDAFADLTDSGVDFSQFAEGKTAYSVVDGKNYGVPFDNGAVIACYRTDVLEQAGLTIDDFTDITWDQYIENGKKVLDATGKPLISMQAGECDLIMMMLQSAGSSLFNEDGTANIVNNDTLKVVMETYKELKDTGVLTEVNSWDEYVGSFVSGDVAGTINGCWIMASIKTAEDQNGNWAITDMPSLVGVDDATNYSNNGGSSWAVTSNCQNKDLAEDFLKSTFGSSTDFYDAILPQTGAIACYLPAGESDVYNEPNEFFNDQPIYSTIVEYSSHIPEFTKTPYHYEARECINTAVVNIVNGTAKADALQEAQDTLQFKMTE